MVDFTKARRSIDAASVTSAVKNYPGECAG
jgi:hypothetical protein